MGKFALKAYHGFFLMIILLILAIGVLLLYSITFSSVRTTHTTPFYIKQLYWIGIGTIVFWCAASVDYHQISKLAYLFYGASICFLVAVLVVGHSSMGARRWMVVGPLTFQPSEMAKVSLILVLARYFSSRSSGALDWRPFVVGTFLLLVPILLILKQPDMGTAVATTSLYWSMLLVLGLRRWLFLTLAATATVTLPFLWKVVWDGLKEYQRERILTFFDPSSDPMGTGYHIAQSKIAIGSGGLFGKGLLGNTQSQLRFLPASHTDFIFSVFAEEWGFVGVSVLFGLFFILILFGIHIAYRAKDLLGTLIAVGIIGLIMSYFLVNIGMTLGVMPVVGIPLPFISYGGSAMVTMLGLLGLLFNVSLRRSKSF